MKDHTGQLVWQAGGRIPPHNLEAEEAVLGAMLLAPGAVGDVMALLGPDDFYKPAHGHIFEAIVGLFSRSERPDVITVANELGQAGLLGAIGGPSTLTTLQAGTPSTSNVATYARIVAGAARLRRLIGVAGEIAEIGYSGPADVDAAVDRAESILYELSDHQGGATVSTLADVLVRTVDRIEARANGTEPPGMMTGLADLDDITGGFPPGSLVCCAARPAQGKTQFGAALATHVATTGQPVLFVSAEMGDTQMGERFLAHTAGLSLTTIRRATLAESQWATMQAGVETLGRLPIHLMTLGAPTVNVIRSNARRLSAKLGIAPLIVVDYLQLLRGPKAENRNNEVAALSWGLKGLALDLSTVVFTLSQLSRQVEARADKHPMLSDLRDSGAIEQDSDVVLGLYRDEVYHPDSKDRGVAEIVVLKNRHGRTGTARVTYNPATGRYFDIVRSV